MCVFSTAGRISCPSGERANAAKASWHPVERSGGIVTQVFEFASKTTSKMPQPFWLKSSSIMSSGSVAAVSLLG